MNIIPNIAETVSTSPETPDSVRKADMVVVGGGPVGLWTAILAKVQNPDLNIVVVEKYEIYKRNNPLRMDRSSFASAPKHAAIQHIVNSIFPKNQNHAKVNTNTIEDILYKQAEAVGIKILKGKQYAVENPDQFIRERCPNVKFIVGADGSHSQIRTKLFGGLSNDHNIQYLAQVKYKTRDKNPKALGSSQWIKMATKADAFIVENPKKSDGNDTEGQMNLLIDVDADTFHSIEKATFGTPYRFDQCSQKLQEKIVTCLESRRENGEEVDNPEQLQVSSVRLNAYASHSFIKLHHEHIVAIVGDSAFGVPYFKALNDGLVSAIHLSSAITETRQKSKPQEKVQAMQHYESYMQRFYRLEILVARLKGLCIRVFSAFISFIGFMPRKIRKITKSMAPPDIRFARIFAACRPAPVSAAAKTAAAPALAGRVSSIHTEHNPLPEPAAA